jgi:uncharacterized membrane protein YuzA (DUF378 family)
MPKGIMMSSTCGAANCSLFTRLGFVVSHPSRQNKYTAKMGHPGYNSLLFLGSWSYYVCMRFPAKSAIMTKGMNWMWVGLSVFNIIFCIHFFGAGKSFSGAVYLTSGLIYLSFPFLSYIVPIFTYSEMDASCLRLHKFWKKEEIAWHEVRSVNRFGFTDSLTVSFGHQIDDYGRITVTPADREQFVSTIRQYAPQAEINV